MWHAAQSNSSWLPTRENPPERADVVSYWLRPRSSAVVAGQTGLRIPGARMLPLIVGLMAGHAVVRCRGLEERIPVGHRVARRAVQEVVIADQGEPAGEGDVISLCPRTMWWPCGRSGRCWDSRSPHALVESPPDGRPRSRRVR